MPEERRSIRISNGKFEKSVVATGDVYQTHIEKSRVDTDDLRTELRAELRRHRDELIRLAADKGPLVKHDLDEIDHQLAEPKPDAGAVRSRWKTVTRLVTEAGGAAESLTKIAELVRSLFGP